MTRLLACIALGIGLTAGTQADAEQLSYAFDMSHSRIFFDVNHRGYSTMHGRFAEFAGTFRFDAEDPANSSLDVTIDPTSIDMFHEGLNNHLQNPDFFDVEQYPALQFVSDRVEVLSNDRFTVHGQFTMLGQTHPLAFDVVVNQTGQGRGGAPSVRAWSPGSCPLAKK